MKSSLDSIMNRNRIPISIPNTVQKMMRLPYVELIIWQRELSTVEFRRRKKNTDSFNKLF